MLSEKLREQTKIYHQQTEVALIGRIKNIAHHNDYADLLKIFYGYFGGLEKNIDSAIDRELVADYAERRKTSAIADDLENLGAAIPETASNADLPAINNHLQAMGALYVIEGSTLGGKIISKMISQKLDIQDEGALSFFNGYGQATDAMWESFRTMLNNQAKTPDDEAAVIDAANNTFIRFKAWIEKQS